MAQQERTYMDDVRTLDPAFFLLVGAVAGFLAAVIAFNSNFLNQDFLDGLAPEAVGIALTVLVLDRLAQRREHAREERELKTRLIREMGSSDNGIALAAVTELRAHRWLYDGSLEEADLVNANLEGANLWGTNWGANQITGSANLQKAHLTFANLDGAVLWYTNLQEADLSQASLQEAGLDNAKLQRADLQQANLRDANLDGTNLQETDLRSSNLQGANLTEASLQGADLSRANLLEAKLLDTKFDKKTRLPDSTYWTPDTDISRFTDPNHHEFWRSNDPASVAYRGKTEGDRNE